MERSIVALLGCLLLLGACASPQTQPEQNAASHFDAAHYLIGHGVANSREDAENRARADLAKTFAVAIVAQSEDVQSYSHGKTAGETKTEISAHAMRSVSTRTEQLLRGVQIVQHTRDPSTGLHAAVAVLPRVPAAMSLRQDIDRLDDATRKYLTQARDSQDLLRKIAAASRAVDVQAEREASQRSLRVLDPAGRGVEPVFNAAALAADRDALLARLRIAPASSGGDAALGAILSGAIADAGFSVAEQTDADYVLEATLPPEGLTQRDGWYWWRGALMLNLRDKASGKVRGNWRWEIKASAQQESLVHSRVLDEVSAILTRELRKSVVGFSGEN